MFILLIVLCININVKLLLFLQVYRNLIIKYLPQQREAINKRRQKTLMNGLLGTFVLKEFDNFFNNYKLYNELAQEALIALEQFLPALNEFFDLCEDLTDAKNSKINWYSYTNITPSGDYIRAKSKYYNKPVSIQQCINQHERRRNRKLQYI